MCICAGIACVLVSDRIKQRLPDILSVSVPQAWPTELTLNPTTVLTAAARLSVDSFLSALVTCRALKTKKETSTDVIQRLSTFVRLQYRRDCHLVVTR